MEFKEQLNTYMTVLDCSAKTLAEVSNLSPTVLSRYRNGERIPAPGSEQLQKLCSGISQLAQEAGRSDMDVDQIYTVFVDILNSNKPDPHVLGDKLNLLISALEINKAELSRFLNYDPSYLSRICSGQRTPSNSDKFILEVCRFISKRCARTSDKAAVADLIGCTPEALQDEESHVNILLSWFDTV